MVNRATLTAMRDGYGAAAFCDVDGGHLYVELQVMPGRVRLYLNGHGTYRGRRAEWHGADAVAVAGAVCDGDCPAAALADWFEEHAPVMCDHDFDAPGWLRKCSL